MAISSSARSGSGEATPLAAQKDIPWAHRNPARLAWIVLLTAFAIFCALAIAVPLAVRSYLFNATKPLATELRLNKGTALVLLPNQAEPVAVVDARNLEPAAEVSIAQGAQATLRFATGQDANAADLATAQLYPESQVVLVQASRPRFGLSPHPHRIVLRVVRGRVRLIPAPTAEGQRPLSLTVETPHATVDLAPGSYAVEVDRERTLVATRFGLATVRAAGSEIAVAEELRAEVAAGQPPSPPVPLAENLIADGRFEEPLGPPNWLVSFYPDAETSAAQVAKVEIGGRQAVRFSRINQPPTHTEVAITQVLNRSVQDYEYLNLQMDVLVRWQSLPGAGEQSSEFPVMFWLDYIDIYGNHQFWTHGFYYRDPPPQWVVTGGTKIAQGVWYAFESGNLLERLPMEGRPLPSRINWLKIYASGHNFDSLVTEVRLVAR